MTRAIVLKSREDWLRHRKIGGSDVAAILGLSPYRTGWDVYARLVEGQVDDSSPGPDAARGVLLEPTVLREYARATGRTLKRLAPHTLFEREGWATASLDALTTDGRIVEVKTDRHRDRWGAPATIDRWTPEAATVVRRDYYLQVAHYMHVLDLDVADLAVLVPGDDPLLPELRIYTLLRDREVEEALVDTLRGWWDRHVVGRVPPELDGSPAASQWQAAQPRKGARKATAHEVALAAQYVVAQRTAAAWEAQRRTLAQHLVAAAGDAQRLELPVGRVTVTRSSKTTLDERALFADHPDLVDLLDRYRRTSTPYTYPTISGLETP